MKIRRLWAGLMILSLAALLLGGCARKEPPEEAEAGGERRTYALVVKDVNNPYMQYMSEGFERACAEKDAAAIVIGPDTQPFDQFALVEELIEQKVDAIAIAVNEMTQLSPVLKKAREKGIAVVSVDSNAEPSARDLHIQQASPEVIGRVLVQAAYEMLGGSGRAVILSTTATMPNQALWVEWMYTELRQYPEKYAQFHIEDVVYGQDDYGTSAEVIRALLDAAPQPDIIISPTSVGILAAADVLEEKSLDVRVTGLGLPSDMAEYIRSGRCPWMYLWNPIDMGYIAAYACNAIANADIRGEVGETLLVGSLGEKLIVQSADGGTEIVVGNPYQFDNTNIAIWEDMF